MGGRLEFERMQAGKVKGVILMKWETCGGCYFGARAVT
jgi:hypothetical protein